MKKFKLNLIQLLTLGMLTIFPLAFDNYYYNISIVKYYIFVFLSLALICTALYLSGCRQVDTYGTLKFPSLTDLKQSISKTDLLMLLFLLNAGISVLCSEWKLPSLTGSCGRYNGFLFLLAAGALYYGITRHLTIHPMIKYAFPVILILTCSMALIQFCGYDFLGFFQTISEKDEQSYISTFGNLNIFAAFICVYLPICMYQFCILTDKSRILYGVGCFFGFTGILTSNSDSCYLGFGLATGILAFLCLDKRRNWKHFLQLNLILAAAFLLFHLFGIVFANTMWVQSSFTRVFSSFPMIFGIVLMVGFLYGITLLREHAGKNFTSKARFIFLGIFLFLILALFLVFLWFSVFDRTTNLSGFTTYLRFGKSWGSDRGYAWIWAIEAFCSASFLHKLFGFGPDTTALIFYSNHKSELHSELGFYFLNAHNEYLNYLITVGLLGMLLYMVLIIFSVIRCFQRMKKDSFYGAVGLSILSYAAMSVVNISQPITVPFLYLLLALANMRQKTQ